jgi:tetratricopeptide (TPR) repeat protein
MKKYFVFIMLVVTLNFTAVEVYGQSAEAVAALKRGGDFVKQENYDKAITELNEAIRLYPNFAEAYIWRGMAYVGKRDLDRAIEDYTKAIGLRPNYEDAYYGRGGAYYRKGDYDRAIADYETVLKISPNNIRAKENLEDARKGKQKPVYVTQNCSACNGTGKSACWYCKGAGILSMTVPSYFGPMTTRMTCTICYGSGKIECTTCGGSGKVTVEKR